jgi:hypothetical protein
MLDDSPYLDRLPMVFPPLSPTAGSRKFSVAQAEIIDRKPIFALIF